MNEGKRIEGEMFRSGSVGWIAAVVLLCVGAAGVLVVGHLVNRWAAMAGGPGMGVGLGTGAAWTGPMAGLPGPGTVSVGSVQWPVPAEGTFREHWEKKQAGIGTLNQWYMDPDSPRGYQWASSISIPVKGENQYVIVVHLPRGVEPPDAQGGQLWVCKLGQSSVGDIMPNETTVLIRARLEAAEIKHLWEKGFPPGLVRDLIEAANGKGPLAGAAANATRTQQYYAFTPIDKYFAEDAGNENAGSPGAAGPKEGE